METPGVDSRVSSAAAGAEFRWMGNRLLDATGGFVGSLSPRMPGEPDFTPVVHRVETSVEPEIDYEGLPQGSATSTHMLAGSVAGIMEHCLMYPIDCVKVMQLIYIYIQHSSFFLCRPRFCHIEPSHWLFKPWMFKENWIHDSC